MQLKHYLVMIGLEGYAVLLALYRSLGSVHTDEAKYLLNIPYPHPPLARTIIHAFEPFAQQELLWRMIFATLLIQCVWLIARMEKSFSAEDRLTLCAMWLFSASVLFQSGTVMMAVLTAVQGLVLVWVLLSDDEVTIFNFQFSIFNSLGWVALFWLVSLFTAYQAVLYLPIVIMIFWKARVHPVKATFAIGVPLLLIVLYVASNPLAAASFTAASEQNVGQPIMELLHLTLTSWLWAGSVIFSVMGLIGMIKGRQWALLISFVLVCGFHITSYRVYYPVLFLPLLVGGVIAYPSVLKHSAFLLALQIIVAVYIFAHTHLTFYESDARTVMRVLNRLPQQGVVLIEGPFGHDWQYESTTPILKYRPSLLSKAKAVVCNDPCPEVSRYEFYQVENIAQEVWVRK